MSAGVPARPLAVWASRGGAALGGHAAVEEVGGLDVARGDDVGCDPFCAEILGEGEVPGLDGSFGGSVGAGSTAVGGNGADAHHGSP